LLARLAFLLVLEPSPVGPERIRKHRHNPCSQQFPLEQDAGQNENELRLVFRVFEISLWFAIASSLVHGAEMRVAETRAVNRALLKAYGIGLCSVEELGAFRSFAPVPSNHKASSVGSNGHQNDQPRLRDRLCLLIRQHQLDATPVKAFAAEYCGTLVLRDASRESIIPEYHVKWAAGFRQDISI
jgi:hypothetical protein